MSDEDKVFVFVGGEPVAVRFSVCREETCRARMVWTVGPKGGKVPVDVAPTEKGPYILEGEPRDLRASYAPEGVAPERRHASHFSTCPAARRFSRKGKERGPRQEKHVVGPTTAPRADMMCPRCGTFFAGVPSDARCGADCFDQNLTTPLVPAR